MTSGETMQPCQTNKYCMKYPAAILLAHIFNKYIFWHNLYTEQHGNDDLDINACCSTKHQNAWFKYCISSWTLARAAYVFCSASAFCISLNTWSLSSSSCSIRSLHFFSSSLCKQSCKHCITLSHKNTSIKINGITLVVSIHAYFLNYINIY